MNVYRCRMRDLNLNVAAKNPFAAAGIVCAYVVDDYDFIRRDHKLWPVTIDVDGKPYVVVAPDAAGGISSVLARFRETAEAEVPQERGAVLSCWDDFGDEVDWT